MDLGHNKVKFILRILDFTVFVLRLCVIFTVVNCITRSELHGRNENTERNKEKY